MAKFISSPGRSFLVISMLIPLALLVMIIAPFKSGIKDNGDGVGLLENQSESQVLLADGNLSSSNSAHALLGQAYPMVNLTQQLDTSIQAGSDQVALYVDDEAPATSKRRIRRFLKKKKKKKRKKSKKKRKKSKKKKKEEDDDEEFGDEDEDEDVEVPPVEAQSEEVTMVVETTAPVETTAAQTTTTTTTTTTEATTTTTSTTLPPSTLPPAPPPLPAPIPEAPILTPTKRLDAADDDGGKGGTMNDPNLNPSNSLGININALGAKNASITNKEKKEYTGAFGLIIVWIFIFLLACGAIFFIDSQYNGWIASKLCGKPRPPDWKTLGKGRPLSVGKATGGKAIGGGAIESASPKDSAAAAAEQRAASAFPGSSRGSCSQCKTSASGSRIGSSIGGSNCSCSSTGASRSGSKAGSPSSSLTSLEGGSESGSKTGSSASRSGETREESAEAAEGEDEDSVGAEESKKN